MAASYPGAIKSFTSKTDEVDTYQAAHVNDMQDEINAIEAELGTDVAGSKTDLKTRLAVQLDNDGTTKSDTSEPGSPGTGQLFFNTTDSFLKVYNGTAWDKVGANLSRTQFSFTLCGECASDNSGILVVDANDAGGADTNQRTLAWFADQTSYLDCIRSYFYKLSSVDTVRVYVRARITSANGDIEIDIGGQPGTVAVDSSSWGWVNVDVDVSALTDDQFHVLTVAAKLDTANAGVLVFDSVIGIDNT